MGISKKGADPSRAERKAKKRKLEDAIPDLPGDNETTQGLDVPSGKSEKASKKRKRDNDGLETATNGAISEKERKAAKEAKKEQKRLKDEEDITAEDVEDAKKVAKKDKKSKKDAKIDPANINTTLEVVESEMITKDESVPRKSKKERKAERKAKEAAEVASTEAALLTPSEPAPEFNGDATLEEKKPKRNNRNRERKRKASGDEATNGEGTAPRFIVFIGNLPFSANTESIQKHFAAVKPKSVRHLTKKEDPTKSKGCAFVEFDGYDHMKTCLKLFHHSMFDDGVSPPRKMNVELTAGGGGNTKERRSKIKGKNQKLDEERSRRIQEEQKAKWAKKEGAQGAIDESAIHPSRRGRVPGA